jgi:hypothetical protein
MATGCVMLLGRRREGGKRGEVGQLGQKWAVRGTGLGHIGEMGRRICGEDRLLGKTNGPIKVEDFGPDSKVVFFLLRNFYSLA